ncbi:uncharacterized protein LAJ45_01346 [Morchella importuna]|uniref:uncharacterized protein n=1 Tax=Morchella importuna TaxID=1174673 RepID=UPI001E8E7EFF|nr:uncharacterized protein LAJ45_01346 [Morchella importuna]KAH8154815.1 hypothetical protein LAJ45_01346 [Morchella importuna]
MAFRAPPNTRHLSIHSIPPIPESDQHLLYSPQLSSPGRPPSEQPAVGYQNEQETDEWVVFSPSTIGTATVTTTSDLGSVVSAPCILRHGNYGESEDEEEEDDTDDDYMDDDDGTETDSLQPFRELANDPPPVRLPTHDGLGTFPLSSPTTTTSTGVLRSLEESLRIVAMAGSTSSNDSDARIDRWRRQHSQALLDEIERVTRRKMSVASLRGAGGGSSKDVKALLDEETGFMAASTEEERGMEEKKTMQGKMEEEEQRQKEEQDVDTENPETIWRRITRRFIRDIMGIDDELLQVIFGEALPESSYLDPTSTPLNPTPAPTAAEDRLLNRLARELGVLVTQYTSHPAPDGAAFSTLHRADDDDADNYNDDGVQTPQPRTITTTTGTTTSTHLQTPATLSDAEIPHYNFTPTLHHSDTAQWGLDIDDDSQHEEEKVRREYWEQELGVRVFFSFLKSRFSSPSPPPQQVVVPGPMFQQHPLIRSPSEMRSGGWGAAAKTVSRSGSGRSARGFYWDVASSVGSGKGSCVGTGVWAAI